MLDEQADSGSSSEDNGWQCRQLGRLEDLARQSCASALAKCVPVKNVEPDVCFLVIDSSGKTRCAENASNDSSGKRRCVESASTQLHVLRPFLTEFSEYFRKCFEHDLCERRHNIVHVSEFNEEVSTAFVEFLYTGEIRDVIAHSHDLLCELARMGKYYQVTPIQEQCFTHLSLQSFCNTSMKPVLDNLLANGFGLEELRNLGCCRSLLRQLRMTPSAYFNRAMESESVHRDMDLAFSLLSRRDLRQEAGCVQILRMRGWPLHIIAELGYSVDEMRGGGVSITPRLIFNRWGTKTMAMIDVIAAGFPVKDLLEHGFTSSFVQGCIDDSYNEFREHGYTNSHLRALGYAERLLARS